MKDYSLTFGISPLFTLEATLECNGQTFLMPTNVIMTPEVFKRYYTKYGNLTDEGKKVEAYHRRKCTTYDCEMLQDYFLMIEMKQAAHKIVEEMRKGGKPC